MAHTATERLECFVTEDSGRWLRPVLIVGPLLLSAAFAIVASQGQLSLLAALIFAIGAFMVFLRWPPLGLIATAVAGLIVPFNGPGGLSITTLLIAAMLGIWLLQKLVGQSDIRLVPSRTMWPLFAFTAVAFLSFGFGQFRWFAFAGNTPLDAQLGALSIIIFSAAAFLLVANQIHDLVWLSRLTWAFLALATLSFVGRTLLPLLGLPTRDMFQTVGSLFYVWFIAIAFSQAILNRHLKSGWRIALGLMALVPICVLLVFKFSEKSAWMPPVAAIFIIVALYSKRAGLALTLVGALSALFLVPEFIATDRYSIYTRFEAWAIMAKIIEVSPVWGLGFANYYAYTALFPIRGYMVSFNSHNNYVDIIAQMGLVGMACFTWFFWEVGMLGWRLRKAAPEGFAQSYVFGALGGLAGTIVAGMLGDWVLPFVYNIGLTGLRSSILTWIFLGGLVSLEQIVNRPDTRE